MLAADPRLILLEASRKYVQANMSGGLASWYEGQIEGYLPGLVDALLAALAANKLEIK